MMNLQEMKITNQAHLHKLLPIAAIYDSWIYLQNLYMWTPYYWLLSTDGDPLFLLPRVNWSDYSLHVFIPKILSLYTHYI